MTQLNMKNESGRSMVEMLGVLAIVGVLSVGGIAGYTSAMRSYRANEIVNATSMLYMLGIAQNAGAGDAQMVYSTHFGANAVPSGASEITYNADKTITLAITDADICNQVKVKLGDKADGTCADSGTSTLTVILGEINSSVLDPIRNKYGFYDCEDGYTGLFNSYTDHGYDYDNPVLAKCYVSLSQEEADDYCEKALKEVGIEGGFAQLDGAGNYMCTDA